MAVAVNHDRSNFWAQKAGYIVWILVGVLCAVAGLFHPIANLAGVFGWSGVALVLLGMFLSMSSGDATGFCIVVGFGGFLVAMYSVGFAITAVFIGYAILSLVAAALLYGMGALGILGS